MAALQLPLRPLLTGRHRYTDPLLGVGVWEALRQVGWDTDGFVARGGQYTWGQ